jgi:glycerate kinase
LILLGARRRARSEAINEYCEFDRVLEQQCDFVFTGEGSPDGQSTHGMMSVEVTRWAKHKGAQVVALVEQMGENADTTYDAGIKACTSISRGPSTVEEAITQTDSVLYEKKLDI